MANADLSSGESDAGPASEQRSQLRDELETLRILDPANKEPLDRQFGRLNEAEQRRLLETLVVQTETDIRTFSTFLKMPTAAILMLNLLFAYSYVTGGGSGSLGRFRSPTLPFTNHRVHAGHSILATELSVVTLQFTLYLLASGRWDWLARSGTAVLLVSGAAHAVLCSWRSVWELGWWALPALNLALASYAQLNMRRSRADIEKLAARLQHDKDA
ncbi:hypothetical protein GGF46_001417 [Coemansia sp. RSA 552]|nr:hypothetical protein GGF46_001417 [Coemansia sp. RSA 552]